MGAAHTLAPAPFYSLLTTEPSGERGGPSPGSDDPGGSNVAESEIRPDGAGQLKIEHNDWHAYQPGVLAAELTAMRAALYWCAATRRSSWRAVLAVALIGGLLGAVALGSVAGARRTASAYGRYLGSIRASDAFVNIPGVLPGMPAAQALTMISRLPGVAASAGYLGLNANPVVHGKVDDSFLTDDLTGSFAGRASPPTASARTG
jgi:hypothetical protein